MEQGRHVTRAWIQARARSTSVRRSTGVAGRRRRCDTSCACRSWVESTPTSAMLSVLENCARRRARSALLPQRRHRRRARRRRRRATARSLIISSTQAGRVVADERQRVRRAIGLLRAARDRRAGTSSRPSALEHVLLVEDAQLVARRAASRPARRRRRRGTGSAPRRECAISMRSPCDDEQVAGEQRADLEVLVLRERTTSARTRRAASRAARATASRAARARRAASAENSRFSARGRLPARVVREAGRRRAGRGSRPKNCRAIACCATGERARYGYSRSSSRGRRLRARAGAPRTAAPSPRGTGRSRRTSRRRPRR